MSKSWTPSAVGGLAKREGVHLLDLLGADPVGGVGSTDMLVAQV